MMTESNNKWAPDFGVNGRRVLITGGARGIGLAFARAFSALGAEPLITDIVAPVPGTLPSNASYEDLDARNSDGILDLARRTDRLDVLIHCAGRRADPDAEPIGEFQDLLDTHLVGALRLAEAFRTHLAQAKGAIIFISSMYAYFGHPRGLGYSAAKTAINSLTKSLALAYSDDGIRVNAIAPGWIDTDLSKKGQGDPAFSAKVMARLPIKRWAGPEELAGTAVFLASPAAGLINGVTIPVDGGYTAS
jgi:NAD(P)-dependent dehydrogenase (short-subunit alcohol dehydrogenase family)